MTVKRTLLIALLLFAMPLAAQQVTYQLEPAAPTSLDRVTLFVSEIDSCPPPPEVTRTALTFEVRLGHGPCLSPPTRITHRIDLGTLAAGRYVVFIYDENVLADSFQFVVVEATQSVLVRPSLGPITGGTVVEIRANAPYCTASSCAPPTITFGGVPATNIVVNDPMSFRATTPPHAAGPVEVRVSGPANTRATFAFRYYDPLEGPSSTFFERVLIPVIYNGAGARGSMWVTELSVRNENGFVVEPWRAAGSLAAVPNGIPMRFTMGDAPGGLYLIVPREATDALHFNVLVRDTTQQATAWGTEIPIAREHAFSTHAIDLLNVPLDARFRNMLRVYGDSPLPVPVIVRVHSMEDGRQLLREQMTLARGGFDRPAFLALGDDFFNRLPTQVGRVSLRIETFTGVPVWAFVTVTNNETQHVTVISPQ